MTPLWWVTKDGNLDCHELYVRHYSANNYLDGRRERDKRFSGPGEKLVLHIGGQALFVWRRFVDDCIDARTGDRQEGINCAVFRNESQHLSSALIRQADAIADAVWTDRRHYTYVNRQKVASANPGYCFLAAGWRRCGMTKGGLLVLERDAAMAAAKGAAIGVTACRARQIVPSEWVCDCNAPSTGCKPTGIRRNQLDPRACGVQEVDRG